MQGSATQGHIVLSEELDYDFGKKQYTLNVTATVRLKKRMVFLIRK